jgi:hypothetical protein
MHGCGFIVNLCFILLQMKENWISRLGTNNHETCEILSLSCYENHRKDVF